MADVFYGYIQESAAVSSFDLLFKIVIRKDDRLQKSSFHAAIVFVVTFILAFRGDLNTCYAIFCRTHIFVRLTGSENDGFFGKLPYIQCS